MNFNCSELDLLYKENTYLEKDVKLIAEWIKNEEYLPEIKEQQIILFLHSCSYNLEETKKTIINYFTFRTNSDLFKTAAEDQIKKTLSMCFTGILPKKTSEGYIVWYFRLLNYSTDVFDCKELTRIAFMILCLYFHQNILANGLVLLCDMSGYSFRHLFKIQISIMKQFLQFLQEAAPVKLRSIHCVNTVPVTKQLMLLAKPFLRKEVIEMIHFHTNSLESLYEYISRDCLPEEFGGNVGSLAFLHEQIENDLIKKTEFFKWHAEQTIDESKRKPISKSYLSTFRNFYNFTSSQASN